MKNGIGKETKHRSTIAPFECDHCGYTFNGWTVTNRDVPNITLCSPCYNELVNYLWEKPDDEITQEGLAWVRDTRNKPYPRSDARRFHPNVPKWMRSAITQGMVKTNSDECYVVYSQEQIAVKVDIVDNSRLKSVKVRV